MKVSETTNSETTEDDGIKYLDSLFQKAKKQGKYKTINSIKCDREIVRYRPREQRYKKMPIPRREETNLIATPYNKIVFSYGAN